MPDPVDLSYAIGLPPEEAIAYFRQKGYAFSWNWHDVWQEAHAKAFTVAKAMKLDILQDIRKAVDDALANGTTLEKFKDDLIPTLQKKGWWGKVDGAQLGSPHRLQTIFRTNLQSAYMAGRYKQQAENADNRPYWQYIAVMDSRTRPAHVALNKKVFRFDDPFWNTHYPPNGYNCFPAGTDIATQKGWVPIESLSIGDMVLGGSGNFKPIEFVHKNAYSGKLVKLFIKGVGEISSTPNHRILTGRGWIRAENIAVGDVVIQIKQTSGIKAVPVGNIDHVDSAIGDRRMSVPRQGEPSTSSAFNTDIKDRNENINPIFSNTIIKNSVDPIGLKKIDNGFFCFCWKCLVIWMSSRVKTIHGDSGFSHFFSDRWAFGGRGNFQFFGCTPFPIAIFFCFSKVWMSAFRHKLFAHVAHHITSFFPADICRFAFPLDSNGGSSLAWLNAEKFHQPDKRMGLCTPSRIDLPVGESLLDVQSEEGFSSGAPLDFFDSLDDFSAWASHNGILNEVVSIKKIPYNGIVYNLSIKDDESYCVKNAVVHNCRCRVRALTEAQIKAKGLDVESGKDAMEWEEKPVNKKLSRPVAGYRDPKTGKIVYTDPGWSSNPGKEWARWDQNGLLPDCLDLSFADGDGQCIKMLMGQKTWKDFERPDLRDIQADNRIAAPELLGTAKNTKDAVDMLSAALGVSPTAPMAIFKTPIEDIVIRYEWLYHLVEKRSDARERYANFIIPTLVNPYEIWLTEYEDGFRSRYVGLFTGVNNLLVVIRINQDGSILWNIMQARDKNMNKMRVGELLWGQ